MRIYRPHRSCVGDLPANAASVGAYLVLLLFWNFGIIVLFALYFAEKKSGLVRFHAMQAILLWTVRLMCGGSLAFEATASVLTGDALYMDDPYGWGGPVEVLALRLGLGALMIGLVCLCMVHAYHRRTWRIPLVGALAARICRASENSRCDEWYAEPTDAKDVRAAGVPAPQSGDPNRHLPRDMRDVPEAGEAPAAAPLNTPERERDKGYTARKVMARVLSGQEEPAAPAPPPERYSMPLPRAGSPNEQLPPEMRDPPIPEDWFGAADVRRFDN